MEYYIQGDPAKAEQIKAAFKSKGYEKSNTRDYSNEHWFFFTYKGKVICTDDEVYIDLVKGNPNYKELELPVGPKFKVDEWLISDVSKFIYQVKAVPEYFGLQAQGQYRLQSYDDDSISYFWKYDVENRCHLWSITDAEDGDIICTPNNNIFIYKCKGIGLQIYDHCGLYHDKFEPESSSPNGVFNSCDGYVPANKKQRDLLFAKMREAGYEWDSCKKELRKIQSNHYDVSNFHEGMPVLVRDADNKEWRYVLFSHISKGCTLMPFNAGATIWHQCIPFNEKTKHLLGTTNMPSKEYINWSL